MALVKPDELHAKYMELLRDWCSVTVEEDYLRVRFPFVDIHRSVIEAYVVESEAGIRITDYGLLLGDLKVNGIVMDEETQRFERFVSLAESNGFRVENNQLVADAAPDNLVLTLHAFAHIWMFSQGFSLSGHRSPPAINIRAIFNELKAYALTPTANLTLSGQSGVEHSFPIAWSRNNHEVIARVMSVPQRVAMQSFAWSMGDLRATQRADYKGVAFLPPDKMPMSTRQFARVASAANIHLVAIDHIQEAVNV